MPELRQNYITKEWVIIATERAKRPEEMATHRPVKAVEHLVPSCPFCPGNENKTPPEVMRVPPTSDGDWQVRVVANKFAALSPDAKAERTIRRSRRTMGGFGVHDVIIETPDHAQVTALLPLTQVANVIRTYKSRFDALSLDSRIAHVTMFKNHGLDAGASMEHPHSQLIAAPVISNQVRQRLEEALRHYDEFGECMFCEVLRQELDEEKRIVLMTEHFVALEPVCLADAFLYPHLSPPAHGQLRQR
jgi:UDPglucose--hexose-1-phosphate uridylyltransferase